MKDRDEWDYIRQNLELKPGIQTLSDYNAAIRVGDRRARAFLESIDRTAFAEDHIRVAHALLFLDVHPWAGEFRQEEIEIAHKLAAKPENIVRELHMVAERAEGWFQTDIIEQKAEVIAAYHTAFEQIHPFLDGNGRIGRMLLESQVQKEFSCLIDLAADKPRYNEAIQAAAEEHKLNSLRNLIIDLSQMGDKMMAQKAELQMQQAQQQDHGIER